MPKEQVTVTLDAERSAGRLLLLDSAVVATVYVDGLRRLAGYAGSVVAVAEI